MVVFLNANLVFHPTTITFEPQKKKETEVEENQKYKLSTILRWLWRASKGARSMVALIAFIGIIDVALGLLFVALSKNTIDIATGNREGSLISFGVLMGITLLSSIGVRALESYFANTVGIRTRNHLRYNLFSILMQGEWRGIGKQHSGDILNRLINDISTIASLITDTLPIAIITLVQLVASFFFLFFMDKALAVILVLIMPVFVAGSRFYIRKMRKMTKDVRESDSRIHAVMQESLQHKTVIKTLEQDQEIMNKLNGLQDTLEGQVIRRTQFSIGTRSIVSIGFSAGYLTAFLWGVFRIASGSITFGVMTAFLQLVGKVQRPVTDLARLIPGIVGAFTASERIMELEELPLEEPAEPHLLAHTAGVQLKDVTFRYEDGEKNVLSHFSADFPPHSSTAIIGETGAGKTTLIRLLLALIKPAEGEVMLYETAEEGGPKPEDSWPASSSTRCNFVYVPQGNTLISGTIRDNLLLGCPQATDDEMWNVLNMACADFVGKLPNGLDTECGEGGGGFSEGQAQRIAIARSLLRPGSILLLDEATSSLDMETEQELLRRITQGKNGKTLIFITHRSAVTNYCDRVLKIESN